MLTNLETLHIGGSCESDLISLLAFKIDGMEALIVQEPLFV